MSETTINREVYVATLQLGDVVELFEDGYGMGTVTRVKDHGDSKEVEIFRPYAHVSHFSTTGGLIPYVGFETVKRVVSDTSLEKVRLITRRDDIK